MPSSPSWMVVDTEEKGVTAAQHDKLPVLQVCPELGGFSQRGVTAAVTPVAKAMAAMKEKRWLKKSIVKKVWMGM